MSAISVVAALVVLVILLLWLATAPRAPRDVIQIPTWGVDDPDPGHTTSWVPQHDADDDDDAFDACETAEFHVDHDVACDDDDGWDWDFSSD